MAISSVRSPTSVTFVSKGQERPYHDHCPLCIDSLVHPADDNRKPVFIFLDMDGVMIGDRFSDPLAGQIKSTAKKLFSKVERYSEYEMTVAKGRHLHPDALKNLDDLIQRIELSGKRALVVLSTSWRDDATLQQHREEVFEPYDFSKLLCGKAAPKGDRVSWAPEYKQGFKFEQGAKSFGLKLESKADVIEFWLKDHGFDLDSTELVVIDDEDREGNERFGPRYIKTSTLFEKEHFDQATEVLKV